MYHPLKPRSSHSRVGWLLRASLVAICCFFLSDAVHAQLRPLSAGERPQRSHASFLLISATENADRSTWETPSARTAAATQDRFDADVTQQMETFDRLLTSRGLTRSNALIKGSLRSGGSTDYPYQLVAGQNYGFAAVCDRDCSDIDLILINSSGTTVQRDVDDDDNPIITYRPTVSGQYRLRVSMANCSVAPCRFGLASYIEPTAPDSDPSDRFDGDVMQQMQALDSRFSSQGLTRSNALIKGSLANRAHTDYPYQLVEGQNYAFAAVCDRDCSDLDLILINSSGTTVKQDVLRDDAPIITYRPTVAGQYRLRVSMAACSQAPCRFGLASYMPASRVAASSSAASSPAPRDQFDRDVVQQIEGLNSSFSSQGFLPLSSALVKGSLRSNGSTDYAYQLMAGKSYGFAAVCDRDCSDIDLVLADSSGRTVKQDVLRDDNPIITYRPTVSGQYRLRVSMANCTQAPCRFGLATYISR